MASNSIIMEPDSLESGQRKTSNKEIRLRTVHSMSASSLRKKSDLTLVSKVPWGLLRDTLANLQVIFLGTKLAILFPAVVVAIIAQIFNFGKPWIFAFSLIGLVPLAERLSFLTEQISFVTGPTVGGLLNATCGNIPELIIALLALIEDKIEVVKCSLLGSILSNMLLVLGTSLFFGGLYNVSSPQLYDRKQADVNSNLLLMGFLCHMLPTIYRYGTNANDQTVSETLALSRASSIVMLISYIAYLAFQLVTHRQFFEAPEVEGSEDGVSDNEEEPVLGFLSAIAWLVGMTGVVALLSEYIVKTIEDTSASWGISVTFISLILLPVVGNAAEHAGAVIFAFKNKLDITLGVALGSATQVSMFVVPLLVIIAWIIGTQMDLDFSLLEAGSLLVSILITAFTLQVHSSL
eukprot:TRINITY_DN798_c0_g2_i4.p1 TRINITY_DN798_c0_g2~~TRINITY_DN798_c0_g2_i4.p1  ORF type:complete len:407 (+),score=43.74 TRINITY_DN798_c0_g2_i4:133-1353(+)